MNIQQLMQQAQQMQRKMQDAQEKLKQSEFEGVAGGGLVKIVLKGDFLTKNIFIDESLVKNDSEKDVLEDLLIVAFNDAKKKIDEATSGAMSNVAGGMKLPPNMKMPF